jgi:hypothetical protein
VLAGIFEFFSMHVSLIYPHGARPVTSVQSGSAIIVSFFIPVKLPCCLRPSYRMAGNLFAA